MSKKWFKPNQSHRHYENSAKNLNILLGALSGNNNSRLLNAIEALKSDVQNSLDVAARNNKHRARLSCGVFFCLSQPEIQQAADSLRSLDAAMVANLPAKSVVLLFPNKKNATYRLDLLLQALSELEKAIHRFDPKNPALL